MRTRTILILALGAAALAAFGADIGGAQDRRASRPQESASRPGGGRLGTLQRGTWECTLPGDAGGAAFVPVEAEGFRVGNASSYASPEGRGIYLLRGNELVFTRGPKKDQRYRVLGDNTLQKLESDGSLSRLICTRLPGSG